MLSINTDKKQIPLEAIAGAKGLAIFNGFRAGMYFAGAGGSGVVVSRLPDGSWSPPSAVSVRSGSFGLVYGVDVYDCVCVLNTQEAVDAYTTSEVKLGGKVALAAGPMSIPTKASDVKPVWVYTKSKGFYGGLTVDGTVIQQKPELNTDFYGQTIASNEILKGAVTAQTGTAKWPAGATKLTESLKMAEGKSADQAVLSEIVDTEAAEAEELKA